MAVSKLLLIIIAVMIASGQVLLKKGLSSVIRGNGIKAFIMSLSYPPLFAGVVLIMTAPLLYIKALEDLPLSAAFMFNSLTHLFVFLAGRFILGEKAGLLQWIGIALIITGFIFPVLAGGKV